MRTLAIGLGALFLVACASEQGDVYDLDAQLTADGVYGTFVQGDVRVEFSSFEIEAGAYAVTIVGDDFAIDTMLLPPDRVPVYSDTRPMDFVDWGRDGPDDDTGPNTNIDTGDLGIALRELVPEQPEAIAPLLHVLEFRR